MKRLFLFLLLVPVGAAVIWSMGGCGARTEVAVAKIAEQIDDLLGRLDVKRTEIERSLATLKQGQTGLRRARIRAQVKQDQLQRKMAPIERRMSDIDESLDVLRGHLADGTPAELAGKTYPVAQVRVMADRLLEARRLSVRQVDGYRAAQQRLAAVVSTLERKEAECGSRLSGTCCNGCRVADDRDQITTTFNLHPQDGKTVLRVVVGDSLDESIQGFGHVEARERKTCREQSL